MSSEVKRYDPFGYDGLSAFMTEDNYGDYVRHDDYAALEAENAKLRAELERTATWIEELPVPTVGAAGQLVRIDKVLAAAATSAPKADDPVKVELLGALEDVVAWAYRNTKWDCIPIGLVRAQCAIAAARKGEV